LDAPELHQFLRKFSKVGWNFHVKFILIFIVFFTVVSTQMKNFTFQIVITFVLMNFLD
jgi:hypothetical protein